MSCLPGLDVENAPDSGRRPVNLFDRFFPIPSRIGNMRSEDEFTVKIRRQLKTSMGLGKGIDVKNSRDITLAIHMETQTLDDELTDILNAINIISDLDHDHVLKFYEMVSGSHLTDVCFVYEPHSALLTDVLSVDVDELRTPSVIKAIMSDLFSALEYLHRNQIVHRDIHPENIVFSSTGVLKVWNFKNARKVGQKPRMIYVNDFRYQPVELLWNPTTADTSMDIWAAICIFAQFWLNETLFISHGREKVLEGIFSLLGYPTMEMWEDFFSFPEIASTGLFSDYRYNKLDQYFKRHSKTELSQNTLDIMHRCFCYNPKDRLTAEKCLIHPYFSELPNACRREGLVSVLEAVAICCQLREMRNKTEIS